MKNPEFVNLTVFILFFGLALIQAFQNKDGFRLLFLALSVLSLWADFKRKKQQVISIFLSFSILVV